MLSRTMWIGCAIAVAIASGAFAQDERPTTVSPKELAQKVGQDTNPKSTPTAQQFVTEASGGGQAEVALGKLAADKAKSPDVKDFAQMMQRDHAQANQELASLASRKGWTAASVPGPKYRATEQRLSRLTGDAFDKAYMQDMVKDHEKDVRAFEQASKQLTDADLKAWVEKTLPTLRQHLDRARSVEAALGEPQKPPSSLD